MSRRAVFALFFALLLMGACSPDSIAEQIIESQEGVGDVDIDSDTGEVSVETDDGSATFGGGEIPDGFPVDVPAGGKVQMVIEQGDGASVSILYEDDFDDIVAQFENWVESSGVEVVNKYTSSSPKAVSWSTQDGERVISITVTDSDDGSGVIATLIVGSQ